MFHGVIGYHFEKKNVSNIDKIIWSGHSRLSTLRGILIPINNCFEYLIL